MNQYRIPLTFLCVTAIWSTTPLAIQWSSGDAPLTSALLRMLLGVAFCGLSMMASRIKLSLDRAALLLFAVGGLSIFGAMSLIYWSAQSIPSGWIAVLFGLSPIFTGVFSIFIETDNKITPIRVAGILLGLLGLFLVFRAGLSIDEKTMFGVMLMIFSVIISSSSAVLIRHLSTKISLSGMHLTTGSLLVAIPLFAISAFLFESSGDVNYTPKAIMAIGYLGLIGTGIGFSLYYFLLKHCHAHEVAMITLVTPITALLIGSWLNNEAVIPSVWLGAICVCLGLLLYQYKPTLGWRRL